MSLPLPPPPLEPDAHKGDAGRVFVVAGHRLMPGAAVLCVRAAQRAGAGLVGLWGTHGEVLRAVAVASPETIHFESGSPFVGADRCAEEFGSDSIACGPGLGTEGPARAWVKAILGGLPGRPRVFDADALNHFAGRAGDLRSSAGPLVITPHPGEAARLLGGEVSKTPEGRATAARELARRTGAIVCLKGADTVVTDGANLWVNETGGPALATAGSGDVLTGILAAYLAIPSRRVNGEAFGPLEATRAAVHVHGLAGDLAAMAGCDRSVIASDLIDHLGRAQREHRECT